MGRIGRVNRQLNGIVAIDEIRAKAEAKAAEAAVLRGDALGPLHGLPVGIKDLVDTAGLRTTYGSKLFARHVPAADEPFVAQLRRAGGIVWMKTNTPEWGAGGNTFNPVYGVSGNPFAPALTCGGSSGGSAIALATGMLPLAHGSDNAGSLRIPAAYCGVVGMRPTAGLVPSEKRQIGLTHFPVEGPMARTVRDTLLLLSAMASGDTRDPLAGPVDPALTPDLAPADLATMRVAISADLGGFATLDPAIRALFSERTALFRGAFKSAAEAAPSFEDADKVYDVLRAVAFVGTYAKKMREQPGQWGRLVEQNFKDGLRYSIEDVGLAHMQHTRIYRAAQEFFREHDLLITPCVAVPPWPKHDIYPAQIADHATTNYFDWVRLTYGITLLNHPCISIPCGVDARGMPFGIQIVSRRHKDAFLMRVALSLEALLQRHPATARPVPDIDWLSVQTADDPLAKPVA